MHSVILNKLNENSTRQYTEQDEKELFQAAKALSENRFDMFGPGMQRNLDLIDKFFQKNRQLPMTVNNIFAAIEESKSEFVWLTPAEHAWYTAARQNPDLANQVATYLAGTSGRAGALVKDGDPLFENLLLLFNELQSRRESVTTQSIASAEDRIAHRPGRQLHRVPQPRRTEPISRAAKEDDGTPFLGTGLTKQSDGTWGRSPADYKREQREAAERNNPQPTAQEQLTAEEYEWRKMAHELLRYGTHGQQATIKKTFDQAVTSGASWRQVFEACNSIVNQYKRAAAVSVR